MNRRSGAQERPVEVPISRCTIHWTNVARHIFGRLSSIKKKVFKRRDSKEENNKKRNKYGFLVALFQFVQTTTGKMFMEKKRMRNQKVKRQNKLELKLAWARVPAF